MSIGESTGVDVVAVSRWGGDAATRAVTLVRTGQYRAFTEAWLANRQLADATREAYRGDLGGYLDWCAGITTTAGPAGRPEPIDPLAVVFVHINEYARALESTTQPRTGQPYAATSIARKLSAIGSWYTFLVRLGVLPRNPVDGADRPAVDRDHSPTVGLTADEATALVAPPTWTRTRPRYATAP